MTTWDELRMELRARVKLTHDGRRWLGLDYQGRRFAITLSNEQTTLPMIAVETPYAHESWLQADEARARSQKAKVGSLHHEHGRYLARQLLPLEGLTFATLELVMRALAAWADQARPPAPEPAVYCRLFESFAG